MKINEVEQAIGITKKNIRFYEEEGLLSPSRNSNGYRDYTDSDVESLRRIKLLRRLDIPIEEIKSIQKGALTLDDCLERHLVVLKRRAQNLEATVCFSNKLLNEHFSFNSLPSEQILSEMDKMEEGGTSFVNVKSKDKKQRKRGALIGAFSFILFMVFIIGLVIWGVAVDPSFPPVLAVLFLLIPGAIIVSVLFVLKERFHEIEGGELDEASKY